MGVTRLSLPPLPLHASTQADNTTPAKVRFLGEAGFARVILARELTLNEIQAIRQQTDIELEAFVHGALCVSYSGRCYLSAALYGRSANRGECAQCCRLPYTMTDADGRVITEGKHLLSLKDLNRSDELEVMMQAGISSFKIEGRLKDVSYVKNITAFYRTRLDRIFARNPDFCRSSSGRSTFTFEPQPEKSFNRGFTPYYLYGRIPDVTSFATPKSVGEPLGKVVEAKDNMFAIDTDKTVRNGDGLIFANADGVWEGCRANRVEGNRIYLFEKHPISPQTLIYRNFDKAFEDMLAKPSAERKLTVNMILRDTPSGFSLTVADETAAQATITTICVHEPARTNQDESIRRLLAKLGNTVFRAGEIAIEMQQPWFIPPSTLAEMRRMATDELMRVKQRLYRRPPVRPRNPAALYPDKRLDGTANVANAEAEAFYRACGVETVEPACELSPLKDAPLMFTKHCLRYSMGWCPQCHKRKSPFREPYYLVHDRIRLRLQFDCAECRMLVYAE